MVRQPDHIMNQGLALTEITGFNRILPHILSPAVIKLLSLMVGTLRANTMYKLQRMEESLLDEIHLVVDDTLGHDQNSWRKFRVVDLGLKLGLHSNFKATTGESLSRNKALGKFSQRVSRFVNVTAITTGCICPPLIGDALSYVLHLPATYFVNRLAQRFVPQIEQRWETMKIKKLLGEDSENPPQDWSAWALQAAMEEKYGDTVSAKSIARTITLMVCWVLLLMIQLF